MEESSPSSLKRVQEAGAHGAALQLPLRPYGARLDHGRDVGDLHHLPRRAQGDKAAFSSAPELWGLGGEGHSAGSPADPPLPLPRQWPPFVGVLCVRPPSPRPSW